MSDSDSYGEWINSDSERSSDSDSEGSMDGFIAPDTTPEKVKSKRAEISRSNIVEGPRKKQKFQEEEEGEEEEEGDSDSSSDYQPSESDE